MTLADRIVDDLESRIRERDHLTESLTLASLAQRYQVSLTPVRRAVSDLVRRKVLLRSSTGRLTVNPQLPASEAPERRAATSSATIFPQTDEVIRKAVIEASLCGRTDYLREESMAEEFGIGRTALRRVFSELAGEGLLEHVARCGWRPRLFRREEVAAYLEVREVLELKALELAFPHLEAADLEQMRDSNQMTRRTDETHLDNHLHSYFVDKSGNRFIADFFGTYGRYYSALFDYAGIFDAQGEISEITVEMAAQHREILSALLAKDLETAKLALSWHIRAQRTILERTITQLREHKPRRR